MEKKLGYRRTGGLLRKTLRRENFTYSLGTATGKIYVLSELELWFTWLKNMELKWFHISLLNGLFTVISAMVNISGDRRKKFLKPLSKKSALCYFMHIRKL